MSVTYKIAEIPSLATGETGYALSDGSYAAVSFAPGKGAAPDMFSIRATARAITKDGASVLDHAGQPVCCYKHTSTPKQSLVSGKSSGVDVKALALDAVINDPDGLVAQCAATQAFSQLFGTTTGAKP